MPERIVRHPDDKTRPLYHYPSVASYSDCRDRIVCLSERDYNIVLNALRPISEMHTRVYTNALPNQHYEMVSGEEFEQFQFFVSDIYTHFGEYHMCNEILERIAVSLEAMVEAEDQRYLTYNDILEVLNLTPTDDQQDLIEAFQYLGTLFPGLPELKIPIEGIGPMISAWRFNGAIINLLEDISISQRGQAVAQGGIDFGAIYDTLGNTPERLLLKAGYVGWAAFLWNRIKPADVPGWLGWLTSISGLLLGSIRDAGYTIADKIEDVFGKLGDVVTAIDNQTDTTIVNCNNCSSSTMWTIINDDENQHPYSVVENDAGWMDTNEPPVSDDAEWQESTIPNHKCLASHYIHGWLVSFYGREEWELSAEDNTLTLAEKMRQVLAEIPPIGITLNAASTTIGRLLAYLSSGDESIFVTINEVLIDLEEELVCALYNASGPDEARDAFVQVLIDDGRLTVSMIHFLEVFLTLNNVMGLLFFENSEIGETTLELYGSDCSSCEPSFLCSIGTVLEFGDNYAVIEATEAEGYIAGIGFDTIRDFNITVEAGTFTTPPTVPECVTRIAVNSADGFCGVGCGDPYWDTISDQFELLDDAGPACQINHRSGSPFTIRYEWTV